MNPREKIKRFEKLITDDLSKIYRKIEDLESNRSPNCFVVPINCCFTPSKNFLEPLVISNRHMSQNQEHGLLAYYHQLAKGLEATRVTRKIPLEIISLGLPYYVRELENLGNP